MDHNCKKCLLRSDQVVSTERIQLLTQYIPYKFVRFIGETKCCIFDKKIEELEGSVIYFDIIGFTHIIVNYIEGKRDIAELSNTFSDFYSVIIETVRELGGSVFQFAGDSLLICFEMIDGETKQENFQRAFASMLRVLELSDNYNSFSERGNGFILRPKIGIGCGKFNQILLGSKESFITPIIAGAAVRDAVCCEEKCTKQEIIINEQAFKYANDEGLGDNFQKEDNYYHLIKSPENYVQKVIYPEYFDVSTLFDSPYFFNRLTSFLNPVIRQQIKTSFQGFSGEYKDITCVMVRFDGDFAHQMYEGDAEKSFEPINGIYSLMQSKAARYSGYCVKPDISDKGVVFPVLFGTPDAIENKERNALLCAIEILEEGKKQEEISAVNIGIGTGMVYSGEFGGILRKDYTVIGNSVNFASRLMTCAMGDSPYSIIIDSQTKKVIDTLCTTKVISGITCKGYIGEQTAYLFTSLKKEPLLRENNRTLIGRDKELQTIHELFEQSLAGRMSFAPVIGDAGLGKSFLVEQFVLEATTHVPEARVLTGVCYQYEETTVFYCWRSIIKKIINMPEGITNNAAEDFVRKLFVDHFSEEMQWIPVFLNMLGFDVVESSETAEINASMKQYHFFSIIERLLQQAAEDNPLIIVLEDIHWSDSISLGMLEYFMSSNGGMKILVVAVSREKKAIIDFFRQLNIEIIHLEQLPESAASKLAEVILNMNEESPLLIKKIVATSEGNPFFIENIVHSLIENGTLIQNENGKYSLSNNVKSIQNIIIPTSIQNIVLARLNALKFEEQVVCKTASVVGRNFTTDCLMHILPEGITEETVTQSLNDFETHNIIVRDPKNSDAYSFKHMIIHDVIYDTVLENTKKELNSKVLGYLENKYADNYSSVLEQLEYYAEEAHEYDKVFLYAREAAKKSEKQFSSQDTIVHCLLALSAWEQMDGEKDFNLYSQVQLCLGDAYINAVNFDKAVEQFSKVRNSSPDKELQAEALRGLGRCYQEQGKVEDAVFSLEQALCLLGKKAPKSETAAVFAIGKESISFINHSIFQRNHASQYQDKRKIALKTQVDILCILNKLYYFGNLAKVAWSSIANYNNILHMTNNDEAYCIATGDYAVSLVGAGVYSLGKRIYERGYSFAERTQNLRAASIYKSRYAYYFLFFNDPNKSIRLLEEATTYLRKIGEQWELMTAEGALAQNYFLIGDYEKSIAAYLETEAIAQRLHSSMHIGWSYNKVPFMRYLRKEIAAADAEEKILEGVKLSELAHDHMTLCIHYGHLIYIMLHEKQYQKALEYAKKCMTENKIYKIGLPHVKISYVNVVEAVYAAIKNNAMPQKEKSSYIKMAKQALSWLQKNCDKKQMLLGPTARAAAAFSLITNDVAKAKKQYASSLAVLKDSPYVGEYNNTVEFGKENNLD